MRLSRISPLVLVGLCGLNGGCATAPPEQTGLMETLEIDASRRELQILMYGFGHYFAGQVELAANSIQAETDDPAVREAAVLWKLNAVPVMMKACFQNDPSAGMIGAWVFASQHQQYFESGNGSEVFGPSQSIAVETSRYLNDRLVEIIELSWGEATIEKAKPRVEALVAEFPIENQLFVREQFNPEVAAALAGDVTGGLGVAGAMHEQMLALTDRANILTAMVPRQVQWHSELLLAQAEDMVATRIDSAFTDVSPFLEYLSSERRALTEDLRIERSAILEGIAAERLAVFEALADERVEVLASLTRERNATLESLNALTLKAIDEIVVDSEQVTTASIDLIYLRTLQILALPALVALVLAIVVILLLRSAISRIPQPSREP